jgi:hypothetical protein
MVPPHALTSVCAAAVMLPMVIRFPAVPETVNVATVVVVPAVKLTVCGGVSTLRSLNVLEPTKLSDPVPDQVNHTL